MATSNDFYDPDVRGSDEVPEFFCEVCLKDGNKSAASSFCIDCAEYFCKVCLKYHRNFLKDHGILDGDSMPQDLERCPIHREIIKFYCETCEEFACNTCKVNNSHSASNKTCILKNVSDLSKNIEESQELKNLITKMSKSVSESVNMKKNISNLGSVATLAKQKVQAIKNKILAKAVKMEREICARQKKDSETILMLKAKTDTLVSKLKAVSNKLEQRHKKVRTQRSDMFIVMKKMQSEIVSLNKEMDDINTATEKLYYTFEPDECTKSVVKKKHYLGTLVSNFDTKEENVPVFKKEKRKIAVYQYDIPAASNLEIGHFCVLPGQILAVCDKKDDSVKLFNAQNGCIISILQFNTTPTAITYTENGTFAVAQDSRKHNCTSTITYIVWSKNNTLYFKGKQFGVELKCTDIVHENRTLIVLLCCPNYRDCIVQILNMSGAILNTFDTDKMTQNFLFSTYSWLALDRKQKLYVTTLQYDLLTQIHDQLYLLAPAGIAFDDQGCMYASLHGSNKIVYQTIIPGESEDLLTEDDGIVAPNTLRYCDHDSMLYVQTGGIIKVFKIIEKECVWKETLQKVGKWEPL